MKNRWLGTVSVLLLTTTGCSDAARSLPNASLDGSVDGANQVHADLGGHDGSADGPANPADMTTSAEDATLVSLEISPGALSPSFAPVVTSYTVSEPSFISLVTLTPTATSANATISINGLQVVSGMASQTIPLSPGITPITVEVSLPPPSTKTMRYDVIVTRGSSVDYFKASNTGANHGFGFTVSVSGDTLAVGAPGESSSATGVNSTNQDDDPAFANSGAVYVFTRSGTTWSQQAYIKASNTGLGDQFGSSLSLFGDTLAVGAIDESSSATGVDSPNQGDDPSGAASGAVYVYTRSGTTWSQQAYIKASNTGVNDQFGSSLSLSGDTLAVGAVGESSSATGVDSPNQSDNSADLSGAVYVFTRSGATWSQQAYIKASNTGQADFFGGSVSLFGDTLAVGAIGESSSATGVDSTNQSDDSTDFSGAVYVFTRSGTMWSQQAYLKASNTGLFDEFGSSVSLFGDTLAVGADGESSSATGIDGDQSDDNAPASGAVYVFTRSGTTWSQQAYLKTSNSETSDFFGQTVSLSGDTLAVSATFESSNATGINGDQTNNNAMNSGAVYVFSRSGSTWLQQAYVKASNTGSSDFFGESVSVSGNTLAVGADFEDSGATGVDSTNHGDDPTTQDSGAVYLYSGP